MIGVVVWSSPDRQKAVIWCEDQGALAYLQGGENLVSAMAWPMAGDLLELESETIGDLRHARLVSLLNRQHCAEIPALLRDSAVEEPPLRLVASNGHRLDAQADNAAEDLHSDPLPRVAVCGG